MSRFYEPDLGSDPNSPFTRDAQNKLVRRSYWQDMNDRSLVMVMTQGIGSHLTNDEKRAHLIDLKRDHLIDQVDSAARGKVSDAAITSWHFCN
jgi:hypothetical protein